MMHQIIFRAFELFAACLVLQLIVWRIGRQGSYALRQMMLFFVVPAIVCLVPREPAWILTYILHFSLACVYVLLSTGLTSFSPSIAIVERVARSMPKGLKREELSPAWFTDAYLSGARCENLSASGLVAESKGVLRLTVRGKAIAMCFLIFRRFLGLPDLAKG